VTPTDVDMVGTNVCPYQSADFYMVDTTKIMFRMRVNGNPLQVTGPGRSTTKSTSGVWGVYFDTDADPSVNFVLQADESGDRQLEMGTATCGGTPNYPLVAARRRIRSRQKRAEGSPPGHSPSIGGRQHDALEIHHPPRGHGQRLDF
jgi:hypothetical protein